MPERCKILNARVDWNDDFDNPPSLDVLLSKAPEYGPYTKHPSGMRRLSTEQRAIVGAQPSIEDKAVPGWHVYTAFDGPMVTMFTAGPEPDSGFGGRAREIEVVTCDACWGSGVERYDDGLPERCSLCKGKPTTTEKIVGGWHPDAGAARFAGIEVVDVSAFYDEASWKRGYTARSGFAILSEVREAIREHAPEVEWTEGEHPRWWGQPSKAEWRAMERTRILTERLHYAAVEGGHFRGGWRNEPWPTIRPYSELGPCPLNEHGRPDDVRWRTDWIDQGEYVVQAPPTDDELFREWARAYPRSVDLSRCSPEVVADLRRRYEANDEPDIPF